MNDSRKRQPFAQISTGSAGLDIVLSGGIPEYSLNLIAGGPGTGKTTLANQIVFSNATPARKALYFSAMGEPPIKTLRYQRLYKFFDEDKVGNGVRFIELGQEMVEQDIDKVLDLIVREVEKDEPKVVVMDSFSSVVREANTRQTGKDQLQDFLQKLSLQLAIWQTTAFLVGDFGGSLTDQNPVFTNVDGIIWLSQNTQRSSVVRKLQVIKMRGQATQPGLHNFRITGEGIQVFPRIMQRPKGLLRKGTAARLKMGIPALDEMMGGGIPAGDSLLLAGPSGSGKTTLAAQFIVEGIKRNEPGIIVAFEEHPQDYVKHTTKLGLDMEKTIKQNKLGVMYLRPLDLSVDETLFELEQEVARIGAKRVVIDSLSGFEIALASPYRDDFRESLYRLVGTLTALGVTVMMTVEVTESFTDLNFSPHTVSFLTDNIILQRYIELNGQLRKVIMVVKMRGGKHSSNLRLYENTNKGLVIGDTLHEYYGIISGVPQLIVVVGSQPRTVTRKPLSKTSGRAGSRSLPASKRKGR